MSASVPSWATPGTKVICVNDDFGTNLGPIHRLPMLNEVLTVTHAGWETAKHFSDVICPEGMFVSFQEIPDEQGTWKHICWPIGHFRPLVSTKTEAEDVALFRDALKVTQRQPERA